MFDCFYPNHVQHRKKNRQDMLMRHEASVTSKEFRKLGRELKGVIVDETGRDVLYVKEHLDDGRLQTVFPKIVRNPSYDDEENAEEKRVDVMADRNREWDVYADQSSKSFDQENEKHRISLSSLTFDAIQQVPNPPLTLPSLCSMKEVVHIPSPSPPPPKSIVNKDSTTAPACPPPPLPPPPPPLPTRPPRGPKGNKNSMLPPSSKAVGVVSALRPPPAPKRLPDYISSTQETSKGTSFGYRKLKPLHWDKVATKADHSMVWDKIHDSSLTFDDEQIETLFGCSNSSHGNLHSNRNSSSSSRASPSPTAQIFILDPRKSQNTAIVLKSMAESRKEITDALLDGRGLPTDILEKLVRISPTQEEETKLLQFSGDQAKLAAAESFLYHILKAVPSAFIRANVMLFRSNYESEILHVKESLQILEEGCKELRSSTLFLKLLEAILKTGNRMNAGTPRGNAHGFNLTALRKLSDIKSNDGQTTLLHFVVEQVIKLEGRRNMLNTNQNQRTIDGSLHTDSLTLEERTAEYLLRGLKAMKGLSTEFSNVRKAATIENDSFVSTCASLASCVAEIRLLLAGIGNSEGSDFVREMKGFSEECEEELKVVKEEQKRIMEIVNRTTKYYQAGSSIDQGAFPLQLFVIVREFLDRVDRVCTDISTNLQNKNVSNSTRSSVATTPPPQPPTPRIRNFPLPFTSDISRTTSESDDDFSA